jgi:hypothetical protein
VSAFFIVGLRSAGVVPPEGPLLGSIGQLVLLAITALVLYLDARRRREVAFLGNLGIAAPAPAIVGLALPLLVEAVIS